MKKNISPCCLPEELDALATFQDSVWNSINTSDSIIVLYGAGNIGQKLANSFYQFYDKKLFFADKNKSLWGKTISNIQVFDPEYISTNFPDATWVVTVFNREEGCGFNEISSYLKSINVSKIVPWVYPAWKYAPNMFPYYFQGTFKNIKPNLDEIRKAYSLFTDERSKEVFTEFFQISINAPYDNLSLPDGKPEYFLPALIKSLPEKITFADCGAYDGDTLREFLKYLGSERIGEYHAFEPDKENFAKLEAFVKNLPEDIQRYIYIYITCVLVNTMALSKCLWKEQRHQE